MPARILSDMLGVFNLTSFKIEHYHGAIKDQLAIVKYPVTANVNGQNILLVDDVSDSGDTFKVALDHLQSLGKPLDVKTAVIHHKTTASYQPDYYAKKVTKWHWIIYPWAVYEDISVFVNNMQPKPESLTDIQQRLQNDHGIQLPESLLFDIVEMMGQDNLKSA